MPCTYEPRVFWPAKNCTMCFMTPQKSHFQATIMQKMNSYRDMFPWTVGFTSRKNRIFRSQIWRKSTQTKRSTNEQWVTVSSHESRYPWTVGITIRQKSPKSWKWAQTNLGTLETWVSRIGKNCIFRAKNWKSPHPIDIHYNLVFHDSTEIAFSGRQVSLEPLERSSVRVTCWYRENKSGKV